MSETRENRLKRIWMRSKYRGIREMDLILQQFCQDNLEQMDEATLDLYDALLYENDQDLYQWVTGQVETPEKFRALVHDISLTFNRA
ncbi:succinate dehydrogenase assembly factor 2 [Shimia sp. SDUM112013]|uniref:succinate dehydrogenase assembly factor 2 n=1 Tax=Shimia sp. SDUM112013 TaxID=3136160 RepID=UPI0032F00668